MYGCLRVRLPDHPSVHIELLVQSGVGSPSLFMSKASLHEQKVIFRHGVHKDMVYSTHTWRRVQIIPKVGMSMPSASKSSFEGQASSTFMFGRAIENLSQDHSCKNRGQPRRAAFFPSSRQALHIARYVAAKTAEPQLLCVICSGPVAVAISNAMGMYRAVQVVT